MAVIKKIWSHTRQFSDRNRQFFLQRPSSSLQYGGRRQTLSSSFRITDTQSTNSTRAREQTRNIQCLSLNKSLNESGESQTDRIVRDRSESIKVPVSQCCRNSPFSVRWVRCKTFLSELERTLVPSVDRRDRTSPIIKSL